MPNPLTRTLLAPRDLAVIPPSALSVRRVEKVGRVLFGNLPAGALIGPYMGDVELEGLISGKTHTIVEGASFDLTPKRHDGEYRLGAYNALDWGNETALASDGGNACFVSYQACHGLPVGAYIKLLRDVKGPICVDYGIRHRVALSPEYTDLDPEGNLEMLFKVLASPSHMASQTLWVMWVTSRPIILLGWLKSGHLSLLELAKLYVNIGRDEYAHTLEVLEVLPPDADPSGYVAWLEDMIMQGGGLKLQYFDFQRLQEAIFRSALSQAEGSSDRLLKLFLAWRPIFWRTSDKLCYRLERRGHLDEI